MDSNSAPATVVYRAEAPGEDQEPLSPSHAYYYWCSQCDLTFSSEKDRRKHQRQTADHFICRHKDCQEYVFTLDSVMDHYELDHPSVYCEICDKTFKDRICWEWHTANLHVFCRRCKMVFSSEKERTEHYRNAKEHKTTYCRLCGYDGLALMAHMISHAKPKEGWNHKSHPREGRPQPRTFFVDEQPPPPPPDHYETLGVDLRSTHEEILKATKQKRFLTHPDKFSKCNLSAEEMAEVTANFQNVGLAADVLADPTNRAKYDFDVQMWKSMHGKEGNGGTT